MIIVLDSGPVGLICLQNLSHESTECEAWLDRLILLGYEVVLPEIVRYEIRRELIRLRKRKSLERLERLKEDSFFLPLSSVAIDKASEFWAESRWRGKPTAGDNALDIDVLLAAQTWQLSQVDPFVVIATTNKKHLTQFVPAEHWKDIAPL